VASLGLPLDLPSNVLARVLSDLGALARAAREAPATLDRILNLGEQLVAIGRELLEIAERLDARADAVLAMGQRIEDRTDALLALGGSVEERAHQLVELGARMEALGERVDARGKEVAERAGEVVERGGELIAVLPALERALELATPLEGAIDRFGRLVDRLPGGVPRRSAGGA
jgi:uncharacterized protein (DUF3084 family)